VPRVLTKQPKAAKEATGKQTDIANS